MTMWMILFFLSTILAAAGFVVVAVLWLKKLREAVAKTLGETASQQVRSAQRNAETLDRLQHQQHLLEKRIEVLAETNIKLRLDLNALVGRLALAENDSPTTTPSRTLH